MVPRVARRARIVVLLFVICGVVVARPQVALAAAPPGVCTPDRDGETWEDPDQSGTDAYYQCTDPMPGFPGEGQRGWYRVYPNYARHPQDPGIPAISPSEQGGWDIGSGYTANWTVAIGRNPAYARAVTVNFGDGTSTTQSIAPGTGMAYPSFSHN